MYMDWVRARKRRSKSIPLYCGLNQGRLSERVTRLCSFLHVGWNPGGPSRFFLPPSLLPEGFVKIRVPAQMYASRTSKAKKKRKEGRK